MGSRTMPFQSHSITTVWGRRFNYSSKCRKSVTFRSLIKEETHTQKNESDSVTRNHLYSIISAPTWANEMRFGCLHCRVKKIISLWFYSISLGFTGSHWFLLGFSWFYRVLPDFTGIYLVLLGFTGLYWVVLGFTWFDWVLLGFTGFYWVLLGFTGFYWVLHLHPPRPSITGGDDGSLAIHEASVRFVNERRSTNDSKISRRIQN